VSDITPDLATRHGIRNPKGVLVRRVLRGSPADQAGLAPNDVIREVNRRAVTSPDEFKKEVEASEGKPITVLIEREGNTEFLLIPSRKTSSR